VFYINDVEVDVKKDIIVIDGCAFVDTDSTTGRCILELLNEVYTSRLILHNPKQEEVSIH